MLLKIRHLNLDWDAIHNLEVEDLLEEHVYCKFLAILSNFLSHWRPLKCAVFNSNANGVARTTNKLRTL